MPWNPETYNQFKEIRYQPFYDLMAMIEDRGAMQAIDLGCGTGEQTSILSHKFLRAKFMGIDASREMLKKAHLLQHERLRFAQDTTENIIATGQKQDLIFSNAALQWSPGHERLFPSLISLLNNGGQLAVQMPVQKENILNQILLKLVQEAPFSDFLNGWKRTSPVLSIDEYAQIMFDSGLQNIQIIQKVYPVIANDVQTLVDYISSTTLVPYMDRLTFEQFALLTDEFKKRVAVAFPKFPAMYAFKRLLLYGRKG